MVKTEKLDFDKTKFVKAMKQKFKEMRKRKEPHLDKPFHRILKLLSETKYSKFTSHELQTKWRTMKTIAAAHQKKGLLSHLDRAVLGLVNYKNEKATYDDKVSSSSESESSQSESSSEDEKEERSDSESDQEYNL